MEISYSMAQKTPYASTNVQARTLRHDGRECWVRVFCRVWWRASVDSLNAWGVVSPCLCQRLSSIILSARCATREVCQFSAYSAINHMPRCVGCEDVQWVDMYRVQGSLLRGDQRTAWGRWGRLTSSVVYALPLPCASAVRCFSFVFRMDLH